MRSPAMHLAGPKFGWLFTFWLEIRWPSGQVERLRNVPADRILTVEEGKGIVRALEPHGTH
jgi:hypothetical protein